MMVEPTVRLVRPSVAEMVKLPETVAFSATLKSEPPAPVPSLGMETVGLLLGNTFSVSVLDTAAMPSETV